jgi:hypothetical protein
VLGAPKIGEATVRLSNCDIHGRLSIRGTASNPTLPQPAFKYELENILVDSIASLRAGAGDDYVTIVDSVFKSLVNLYGGDGKDKLVMQGNDFSREPNILEFEEVLT